MTEETKIMKEKYQEELKWGSYFFIYGILVSFIISLLLLGLSDFAEKFYFAVSVLQFSVLLIYCSIRCVSEKQLKEKLRLFSKLWIGVKIISIYCFFWTIISGDQFLISPSLLMNDNGYSFVCKEEELPADNQNNLLNELIKFFKRKSV